MASLYVWHVAIFPSVLQAYIDTGLESAIAQTIIERYHQPYLDHTGSDMEAFDQAVAIFVEDDLIGLGQEQVVINSLFAQVRHDITAAQPIPPIQDEADRRIMDRFIKAFGFDPSRTHDLSFVHRAEIEGLKIALADARTDIEYVKKEASIGIEIVNTFSTTPTITATGNPDEYEISWPSGSFLRYGSATLDLPRGTFIVPRPGPMVESLGTTMAADPSTTFRSMHRWSSYTVKANGQDAGFHASYDDVTGVLTIPDPSVFPDSIDPSEGFTIGAHWTLDGVVDGIWTASVIAIVDNATLTISYRAFPGSTRFPDISNRLINPPSPAFVQVFSISNIKPVGMIADRSFRLFDRDSLSSVIEAVDAHRHSGIAGDGQAVVQSITLTAGENIPAFRWVARGADGLGYAGDIFTPYLWNFVGLTMDDYTDGQRMPIYTGGVIENPDWSWDEGGHPYVYAGVDGTLIQQSPTETGGVLVHQLGQIIDSTKIKLGDRLRLIL